MPATPSAYLSGVLVVCFVRRRWLHTATVLFLQGPPGESIATHLVLHQLRLLRIPGLSAEDHLRAAKNERTPRSITTTTPPDQRDYLLYQRARPADEPHQQKRGTNKRAGGKESTRRMFQHKHKSRFGDNRHTAKRTSRHAASKTDVAQRSAKALYKRLGCKPSEGTRTCTLQTKDTVSKRIDYLAI